MDEIEEKRNREISRIKARMKELGYNPRSLSLAATGKEDTVRNLFRGVSKRWRGDHHQAIMDILWPTNLIAKDTPSISQKSFVEEQGLSDRETGLMVAIHVLFELLIAKKLIMEEDAYEFLAQRTKTLQLQNLPDAVDVTQALMRSLSLKPSESALQAARKLQSPSQA